MAELFPKPKLQATVSPSGWRSIKVQTQQAAKSPLDDLAKALGVTSQISQQVAGLQAFEYKQGVKEGEIAAASADLDDSIKNLDKIGEDLVDKGLMQRSQLFGYQKGYRKRIGQREARSTFYSGLQQRLKEVELNPENGNYDIVNQIIQEEEQASIERLRKTSEGSELAIQGFSEYAAEVKDRFTLDANKARHVAIEKFNNNIRIEDLNRDFGPRLLEAKTPEDIAKLQSDIKTHLDSIDEIPRSKVVELFWGGFAVPNINELLVGDNPQPDKAEKILDSILDIDLTGEGGKLGNINREGAYIRSKAVEMRDKVEAARDKIEKDKDEVAEDILSLWTLSSQAVTAGVTKDAKFNEQAELSVIKNLVDAGYAPVTDKDDSTQVLAKELIQSQDTTRLQRLLFSGYTANDSKSEAYSTASRKFLTVAKARRELELLSVSREEEELLVDNFETKVNNNPNYKASTEIATLGIKDPEVIQKLNQKEQEIKDQFWYIKGPSAQQASKAERTFTDSLKSELKALYIDPSTGKFLPGVSTGLIDNKFNQFSSEYIQRYQERIREESTEISFKTDNIEERLSLMNEVEKDIKTSLINSWKISQDIERKYEDQKRSVMIPTQKTGEELIEEIIEAEADLKAIDTALARSKRTVFQAPQSFGLAPSTFPYAPTVVEAGPVIRFGADIGTYAGDRLGAIANERLKALDVADIYESKLSKPNELITELGDKAPNKYAEVVYDIRRRYGYKRFEDAPDLNENIADVEFRFDPRVTPFVDSLNTLASYDKALEKEFENYEKIPVEERSMDDFPVINLLNRKFGIPPEPNTIQEFMRMQRDQFKVR
jgi:hypothetical protein